MACDPEQHYANCELHAKLAIDLDYLRRRSLRFDLLILVRTVLLLTKLGKPMPAPEELERTGRVPTIVMAAWAAPTGTTRPGWPCCPAPAGERRLYPAPGTRSAATELPRPSPELVRGAGDRHRAG